YGIVTDLYRANPSRLRDWIAIPKTNGYEAMHTTVMSNTGRWVEVQIRSKRMDEIAEKGYAAHWKYKNEGLAPSKNPGLDEWLSKIREMLETPDTNALSFLTDFRMNFFSDEVYIYTPKGEVRTLPKGATVLDFAFHIHSEIGFTVIGAKVNHRLVPLNYELKSGDQVEIIYSKNQKPSPEWLSFVVTSRAKQRIKDWLKEEYAQFYEQGKAMATAYLQDLQMYLGPDEIRILQEHFGVKKRSELYYKIALHQIEEEDVKNLFQKSGKGNWFTQLFLRRKANGGQQTTLQDAIQEQIKNKPESLLLGQDVKHLTYFVSECCKAIPGDDVVGIMTPNKGIEVHRTNCPKATELMSQYGNRIVKAKWKKDENVSFLSGISLRGFDRKGLAKDVLDEVSSKHDINIRSMNFTVSEGVFKGEIMLYIQNTEHLHDLIKRVKQIESVEKVKRVDD
ncbi:MAG: TGS domain-containing protein, partial [Bacteroidales bacterium]